MENEKIETLENQCKALLEIFETSQCFTAAKKFDLEKVKDVIKKMCSFIVQDKQESESLQKWMDENDFWKTPASTKFHGNWESGLCVHSLLVTVQALRLAPAFARNYMISTLQEKMEFTAEDVFVSCIAHDFCKAGSYKVEYRNTKDILGNWTKKSVYKTKDELRNLGHGNESVLKLLEAMPGFIKRRNVLEAVSRHMGFSDLSEMESFNYSNFLTNPLVLLIQFADQSAASWYDC
ncbi:MAG: hypothetical protein SO116_02415 [Treponema sp.]|nr:hypothetical protein [Spirochaetia bacterium]MDY4901707.1 hypothetical protein [Treponema sp.]